MEVTTSNGGLFARATGQQRIEFHPVSEAVFFNDITPLLIKFEREDEGEVLRLRVLEPGRTRIAVKAEAATHDA